MSRASNAYRTIARDRTLLFLTVGRCLRSFTQSYLGVLVPLYLAFRGASTGEIGIVVTVWAAGSALLGAAAGFIADRYGRKRVLAGFSALTILAALIFFAGAPIWALAIAGALGTIGRGGGPAAGGAFGPFYSAEQALIAGRAPAQLRNHVFAAFSSAGAFAGAAGFVLTGIPALFARAHLGPPLDAYRTAFALTAVLAAVLLLTVIPIAETAPARSPHAAARGRALSKPARGFLFRLAVTNATNGLAVGFLGPMLVLWFHLRYHAQADQIGAVYLCIALASAIAFNFAGGLVRRIGGAVRMIVSLRVGACALLALLPFMPSLWLAGAVYLVRMLFNSVTVPVRQSYVMGIVAVEERSRVASLSNLPSQFFSMVGPSIAGVLLRETWLGTMLEIASALQLLNASLYWRFFHALLPPEEREAP